MEDKNAQLQLKDDQLERQSTALQERAVQINRQQEELQTLRVRNGYRSYKNKVVIYSKTFGYYNCVTYCPYYVILE